jgi:hypothetical protein
MITATIITMATITTAASRSPSASNPKPNDMELRQRRTLHRGRRLGSHHRRPSFCAKSLFRGQFLAVAFEYLPHSANVPLITRDSDRYTTPKSPRC